MGQGWDGNRDVMRWAGMESGCDRVCCSGDQMRQDKVVVLGQACMACDGVGGGWEGNSNGMGRARVDFVWIVVCDPVGHSAAS